MTTITESEIVAKLSSNNIWVERAIVALFKRQTEDEKNMGATVHLNSVGFNACDANVGSYMAKYVMSGRNLSGKWLEKARKMAIKYRKQLQAIANEKLSRNAQERQEMPIPPRIMVREWIRQQEGGEHVADEWYESKF